MTDTLTNSKPPVTGTNKPKATRTARSLESITKGALLLPLAERAKLRDALIASVASEIQALKDQAANAEKLLS